jgi:hypothetical protein
MRHSTFTRQGACPFCGKRITMVGKGAARSMRKHREKCKYRGGIKLVTKRGV